jgi:ubiquinone/menaquinone biosynthesis C-methylase UbiE
LGATGQLNTEGKIREEFDRRISEHLYNYYWRDLGLFDWQERIEARKNEVPRAKSILQAIEVISGIQLKGKRMLDIGCGWGAFVVAGLEMGIDACGCDVDEEVLDIAALRSKLYQVPENYFIAPAEKLPFADEEFDYVQCNTVLEHVDDVAKAINEFVRVLKKGGIGFIQAPNYWQPVEGHYKILFPPKCPRWAGKIYLKLLGRPSDFLDTINYIDYHSIKRNLEDCGVQVEDIEVKFSDYFKNRSKPVSDELPRPMTRQSSYSTFITKAMWKIMPAVLSFYENFLDVKQIYFLVRRPLKPSL